MRVSDTIRKCVVFVGYRMADGEYRLAGTAFYCSKPPAAGNNSSSVYLITARHVIDGIRGLGINEVCLRINFVNGTAQWVSIPIDSWFTHPTERNVDVAVAPFPLHEDFDHMVIPATDFPTPDVQKRFGGIGVGDEVIVIGLFRHHHGQTRNIPIIRVGNIAAMDEEPVVTKDFGRIPAFLIEARSIGGLSGSPVFVNLGTTVLIDGKLQLFKGPVHILLGIVHGHYDVSANKVDDAQEKDISTAQVNMGIAIVTPYYKVTEVLNHPSFLSVATAHSAGLQSVGQLRIIPNESR